MRSQKSSKKESFPWWFRPDWVEQKLIGGMELEQDELDFLASHYGNYKLNEDWSWTSIVVFRGCGYRVKYYRLQDGNYQYEQPEVIS